MPDEEDLLQKEELITVQDEPKQAKEPEAKKPSDSLLDEFLAFARRNRRAFVGAIAGILFACLCMLIGFLRTLFITAMALLGIFLFSVDDKQGAVKRFIGKFFPPRD